MKKFFTSAVFVLVFTAYALYQNLGSSSLAYTAPKEPAPSGPIANVTPPQPQPAPQPAPTPTPTPKPTPQPVPTPVPAPKPKGQYVDGTYKGGSADAYYGYIQVEAVISGGRLADVKFLQYPNDRSTSRYINSQAMPILKSQAIQAQSAQVDGVSGASDTSAAFQESLASALAQAKS